MSQLHIKAITIDVFNDVLSRYQTTVPERLRDLDTLRYNTIPARVVERQAASYPTKDEVEQLVEWKLKHGTFRPKLLSLVQSNSTESITDAMKRVSELRADPGSNRSPRASSPLPALKILAQLKGIGPATASLLLSVMEPDSVPFFSDELFRWCMWDSSGSPGGWKRVIKYNVKEYAELVESVRALRERLDVRAMDVERVAWVLGKEGVDVDAGNKAAEVEEEQGKGKEDKKEREKKLAKRDLEDIEEAPPTNAPKKGTKRKAGEVKPAAEGTRKSSRARK